MVLRVLRGLGSFNLLLYDLSSVVTGLVPVRLSIVDGVIVLLICVFSWITLHLQLSLDLLDITGLLLVESSLGGNFSLKLLEDLVELVALLEDDDYLGCSSVASQDGLGLESGDLSVLVLGKDLGSSDGIVDVLLTDSMKLDIVELLLEQLLHEVDVELDAS